MRDKKIARFSESLKTENISTSGAYLHMIAELRSGNFYVIMYFINK
jgi:hypothetical protein